MREQVVSADLDDLVDDRGAPDDFLRLFSRHQRTLTLYLTSMLPTQQDADDVFQETCLVLWREFSKFQIGTNFGAWACTIAFNQVRAWRTRQKRESLVFSDAFLEAVSEEMIDHASHYQNRLLALERCVESLPEHHRELVRHRYLSGATVEVIAEQANRSPVAVYRMLSRVRQALHDCVTRRLAEVPSTNA